jgi:hypothetical protein
MVAEDDLELGQLRLLEVDNRVVVPVRNTVVLLLLPRMCYTVGQCLL